MDNIRIKKKEFEKGKLRNHEECDGKGEQLVHAGYDIRQRAVCRINLNARTNPDVLTADSSVLSKRVR